MPISDLRSPISFPGHTPGHPNGGRYERARGAFAELLALSGVRLSVCPARSAQAASGRRCRCTVSCFGSASCGIVERIFRPPSNNVLPTPRVGWTGQDRDRPRGRNVQWPNVLGGRMTWDRTPLTDAAIACGGHWERRFGQPDLDIMQRFASIVSQSRATARAHHLGVA